jgi:hypothetical protein
MTSRPRITTSRSRAFDALIGTGFAVLVIGVAIFGDLTYQPAHRTALASMDGVRASAMTLHCRDKGKSACAKPACAGKPPCSR